MSARLRDVLGWVRRVLGLRGAAPRPGTPAPLHPRAGAAPFDGAARLGGRVPDSDGPAADPDAAAHDRRVTADGRSADPGRPAPGTTRTLADAAHQRDAFHPNADHQGAAQRHGLGLHATRQDVARQDVTRQDPTRQDAVPRDGAWQDTVLRDGAWQDGARRDAIRSGDPRPGQARSAVDAAARPAGVEVTAVPQPAPGDAAGAFGHDPVDRDVLGRGRAGDRQAPWGAAGRGRPDDSSHQVTDRDLTVVPRPDEDRAGADLVHLVSPRQHELHKIHSGTSRVESDGLGPEGSSDPESGRDARRRPVAGSEQPVRSGPVSDDWRTKPRPSSGDGHAGSWHPDRLNPDEPHASTPQRSSHRTGPAAGRLDSAPRPDQARLDLARPGQAGLGQEQLGRAGEHAAGLERRVPVSGTAGTTGAEPATGRPEPGRRPRAGSTRQALPRHEVSEPDLSLPIRTGRPGDGVLSPTHRTRGVDRSRSHGAAPGASRAGTPAEASAEVAAPWPALAGQAPEPGAGNWPDLLDDSALWAVAAPAGPDPDRIRRLTREQEGRTWNA